MIARPGPIAVRRGAVVAGAAIIALAAVHAAQPRTPDVRMVPVVVDGERVRLQMWIHRPAADGRVPTVILHHGSTGRGTDPALFARAVDMPGAAEFFVSRGFAVVIPARRGRAGSEGTYDEGFNRDRSLGYACEEGRAIAGADRALRDAAAATDAILAMGFVDRDRVLVGGQSRGGILSVAYAGAHPAQVKGVINFVGGWLGAGCRVASDVNQALFRRGAGFTGETLWLYGSGDPFYPIPHSRASFDAFERAGGRGRFLTFERPDGQGHGIIGQPGLWTDEVDAYLGRIGLTRGR